MEPETNSPSRQNVPANTHGENHNWPYGTLIAIWMFSTGGLFTVALISAIYYVESNTSRSFPQYISVRLEREKQIEGSQIVPSEQYTTQTEEPSHKAPGQANVKNSGKPEAEKNQETQACGNHPVKAGNAHNAREEETAPQQSTKAAERQQAPERLSDDATPKPGDILPASVDSRAHRRGVGDQPGGKRLAASKSHQPAKQAPHSIHFMQEWITKVQH